MPAHSFIRPQWTQPHSCKSGVVQNCVQECIWQESICASSAQACRTLWRNNLKWLWAPGLRIGSDVILLPRDMLANIPGFPGKDTLIYSSCRFLQCKYSQLQLISSHWCEATERRVGTRVTHPIKWNQMLLLLRIAFLIMPGLHCWASLGLELDGAFTSG